MRILVVEDEAAIARDVAAALRDVGYVVDVCGNGEDAWFLADTEPLDAMILDLGLPRLDGLSVLRRIRAGGSTLPVIILTARGNWMERVEGIDAGADDYLPKPFQVEELLARLGAVLRRTGGHASPLIEVGRLTLETRRRTAAVDGRSIDLSALEFRLVRYLAHNRGRVVSQGELAEHVYESDREPDSNALEVLIGRIRRKIGADHHHAARPGLHDGGMMRRFVDLRSLKVRLLLLAAAAIGITLLVAGGTLSLIFERHMQRRVADELAVRWTELAGAVGVGFDGRPMIEKQPTDPRYAQPLSGAYWQVAGADGLMLRSRPSGTACWRCRRTRPPRTPSKSTGSRRAVSSTSSPGGGAEDRRRAGAGHADGSPSTIRNSRPFRRPSTRIS